MSKTRLTAIFLSCILLLPVSVSGVTNINNSSQFLKWLEETGTPRCSVSGMYEASYDVFRNYNLVVYGGPQCIDGNEFKDGEYRYLGYTYLEAKYSNLRFPDDATGGNRPENWDYVSVPGAVESWDNLEQTIQKPYMMYSRLKGHGASTLTAADIGLDKARVQSPATWTNTGSIYTYKSNGYYATFNVDPMGTGNLTASMVPEKNTIKASDDRKTTLDVRASVDKPKDEIDYMKVVFHLEDGDVIRFYPNVNSIDVIQPVSVEHSGTNIFNATVYAKSIFGDNLQKQLTCSVLVSDEVISPTPTKTPPPPATPEPKEYDPIRSVELWGDWNYWENEPHRFMSLEKIHVKVRIVGYARKIVIRFSDGLEEMQYTNSEGHTYDYSDDFFGYYVRFPGDSTIYPDYGAWVFPEAKWEYILPLCDETVGWDGTRKRRPYRMTVTVYGRDGDTAATVIDDIDITGNVYELLHPQPSN